MSLMKKEGEKNSKTMGEVITWGKPAIEFSTVVSC
jgi:hypothetical protein